MAGTASALNGVTMMLVAFGMGTWSGTHMVDPLMAMAHGIMLWSSCLVLLGSFALRKIPLGLGAQVAPSAPTPPLATSK
jgi:DHA1 family bicyclomycin/chloramphenicol resistance-like MFS transporter